MNMEQLLRQKQNKWELLLNKYVINIIRFIIKSMIGFNVILIISEELQLTNKLL